MPEEDPKDESFESSQTEKFDDSITIPNTAEGIQKRIEGTRRRLDSLLDVASQEEKLEPRSDGKPWADKDLFKALAKELEILKEALVLNQEKEERDWESSLNQDSNLKENGVAIEEDGDPEHTDTPKEPTIENPTTEKEKNNAPSSESEPSSPPLYVESAWKALEAGKTATAVDTLFRGLLKNETTSELAKDGLKEALACRKNPEEARRILIKFSGWERTELYAPLERPSFKKPEAVKEIRPEDLPVDIGVFKGHLVAKVTFADGHTQCFAKLPDSNNYIGNPKGKWVPTDGQTVLWSNGVGKPHLVESWDVSNFQGGGPDSPLYPYGNQDLKRIAQSLKSKEPKNVKGLTTLKDRTEFHNWISKDLNHPAQINELACQEMTELSQTPYAGIGIRNAQKLGAGKIQGSIGPVAKEILTNAKEIATLALFLFKRIGLEKDIETRQSQKLIDSKEANELIEYLDQYQSLKHKEIFERGGKIGQALGEMLIEGLTNVGRYVTSKSRPKNLTNQVKVEPTPTL